MNAVLKAIKNAAANEGNDRTAKERVGGTFTPEIVIALCGPLGTPLHEVAKVFQDQLLRQDYNYKTVEIIRLSHEIREMAGLPPVCDTETLIKAGNELRLKHGRAILAQRAIRRIWLARQKTDPAVSDRSQTALFADDGQAVRPAAVLRTCHIIDSVKNSEELQLLRSVYGDMLHVIGVYTPIDKRVEKLQARSSPEDVHRLIDLDSGEEVDHGQQVQETFPQSDFFLRIDSGTNSQLVARVRRFLDLMLGTQVLTPTVAERSMYAAFSAASNSACLSRQVGAAITNKEGTLLATGWNDVPKAFGGLYQLKDLSATTDDDHRCYNKDGGRCFNDEEKDVIARTVISKLVDNQVVPANRRDEAVALIRHDSQLRSLIEFSRAVHAEMHALLNAGASHGDQVRGGKLFVTTYPCHSCARHIVAAGIKEVYFVEPYRKSLATKLHSDAITEQESDITKVRIVPFDGVAPSRFLRFFKAQDRKDPKTGAIRRRDANPVTAVTLEALGTLEEIAIRSLESY